MQRERNRRKRKRNWPALLLCVLLAGALVWGVVSAAQKFLRYGSRTIRASQTDAQTAADTAQTPETDSTADIPENAYSADCFYKEGGFLRYEDDALTSEVGVDISSHQTAVDWAAVREAGVDFAILRAGYRGYTEGAIQEDETFLTNLAAAKAAGLKVGVYFFSQALDKAEAVEEAEFVLNLLDGAALDYPIFFDWEDIEADARTDGMDSLTLTSCARAFCKRIELNGYRAGVYFNQRFGYEEFDLSKLQDYELWLAEYNTTPSFAYHFGVWQYANDGMLSGVDGPVDLNLAFRKKSA